MDSEGISLLSPAYLLSVERWLLPLRTTDHYDCLSTLLDSPVRSQVGLCYCTLRTISDRSEPTFARLLLFWEATAPVKLPTIQCLAAGMLKRVRCQEEVKRGISLVTPFQLALNIKVSSHAKHIIPGQPI